MKKFLILFLIGQMLVCSFVYGQSFYDIYILNNMGVDGLNSYYLEEANGVNLGILYDELMGQKASVEIIKEPISMNGIQEYEVYDTDNLSVTKKIPISHNKKITYLKLTKEEFVDSTGRFKVNLSHEQIREISNNLNLTIKKYVNEKVSYLQVIKNNVVNIVVLVLISQFVLLVYTFSRIKINAIKKLNGFSSLKMIVDSFHEFVTMEMLAAGITVLLHFIYCATKGVISASYFYGLVFSIFIVFVVTIIQLLITQFSIRLIDVSSMIKNQVYSSFWNIVMNIVKIVFILAISISISFLSKQLEGYKNTVNQIEKYRMLATYCTSSGYNADEYDKVFSDNDSITELSANVKKLYHKYYDASILIDANITNISSDSYYEIYNTSFAQLNDSYRDNYAVVNQNYYNEYMNLLDENGKQITIVDNQAVVLVPQKYKGIKEVEKFCQEQYKTMMNYDCFYKGEPESNWEDVTILYIQDNQITPVLNEYLLDSGEDIKNSIVFIDNGEFAGTWYLSELSSGKLAFELSERDEYRLMLAEYGLNKLLSVGTMLTPLSENVRYYEFLVYQSAVFVVLFIVTLFMVIYFSNYLEVMVNRKRYALKHLMGFSKKRSIASQLLIEVIILILAIPLWILQQNIIAMIVSIVLDILFLVILLNRIVVSNVSDVMKGE